MRKNTRKFWKGVYHLYIDNVNGKPFHAEAIANYRTQAAPSLLQALLEAYGPRARVSKERLEHVVVIGKDREPVYPLREYWVEAGDDENAR